MNVVTVKGRRAGLEVYELVGIRGGDPDLEAGPETLRLCDMTKQAYAAHRDGDVHSARALYAAVLAEFPGDPLAAAMLAQYPPALAAGEAPQTIAVD
jgi:adenylate cyclase